ncbi:MAG TPA: DUF3810 domain-containing protein [Pyrinomonadaceae bacterium]|nr:DUF3810 domain-containing protein [Pyrinomonadaceae bacterium]
MKLLPPFALLAAVFALQALAGFAPRLVERFYSRALFPFVARALSFASLSSFSLAEMFFALLAVALVAWLTWVTQRLFIRRGEAGATLLSALKTLLWSAAIVSALFMLLFGLNYKRQQLADTLGFERREPSAHEIEAISRTIIEGINSNYSESGLSVEGGGGSLSPLSNTQLFAVLEEAYASEPLVRGASGGSVPPKAVYFSGVMSRLGISGIYSPFTGEPNYNAIQPGFDIPFSVAHEMAHQRGFAREDEANFVAFIVCTKASHPYVRYSGYLGALRVLGVLYRVAPERYRAVVAGLGEGPRADLKARAQFWARYRGRLSNFSNSLNHVYLKVNGIRSGVRNYNEASSLIVGYYLKQSAAP